ncbi:ATP-binding cassette domain-containing protein [Thiomicrorhabdus lithotrophica]|uniref:ATP-binding cassette domain-containing protein n=1 Tax=Thiomicrorhabdus lithotrophica TaxID=2949997 RepID=A0ABY8CCL9_9GAMM|nr:ATP-binding cassette domain-containing protein [Thiomicrorhabdus lithotrophica]WEJ63694.1 ATP-binding cassette domain-containing protein [Thiomicrorhabdus lithotrophica]
MLTLQNLSIRAGVKPLLDSATLTVHPGQKIGLIGQNGVGKTTLFKTILNEVPVESGHLGIPVNWLIGCVEQEVAKHDINALEYVTYGDTLYAEVTENVKQAESSNDNDALVKAYDALDKISGYMVPNKAKQLLYGLGFSDSDFSKNLSEFSGGWQVRLKLARALMQRADLLLLDEPTNHLDIEAVAWLEQWLKSYEGAVLIISHDRDFLDQVVQGIAHIHNQKIYYYSGNFAAFERQRNEQLMQQQALHDKQKQQMQHLKSFIERFKAKASKAKQAQSRVKALERMEEVAAVQAMNPFLFKFLSPDHQPDPMMTIQDLCFSYPDKKILDSVDLVLRAGDRIGLVGVNGSGKTTLLKQLVGELKPQSGKVIVSKGVKVGYFAQHQIDSLNFDQSPLQHMLAQENTPSDQEGRDFLGKFGFSNAQCLESIKSFSGGEKARLALALIVYQKPNLIILDEPTNHLDMETRDALDMAIQEFSGAVILVTHDKHLLASISDQFWWVHNGKVTLYNGDLDGYLQEQLKAIKAHQQEHKVTRPGQTKKELRQQNAQQRKAIEGKIKPYQKELKVIEKKMEKLQSDLAGYHLMMEDESLYDASNKGKLEECLKLQASCSQDLEDLEMRWLELEELIEEIKSESDV